MKQILLSFITLILTNSLYSQNFTIDNDFNIGSGFNDSAIVNQIAIQQDGKIIIVGTSFTQLNGTNISSNIIRLYSDGNLDIQFLNSISNPRTIAIQNDGKIIFAGESSTNNTRIVRYNSDGTIDNTFSVGINPTDGFNAYIDEIALENDGKILVKGDFTTFSGNSVKRLVRLNSNGSLDLSFSGITHRIRCFKLLNSGKILVSEYSPNLLKRINADGTLDNSYTTISSKAPFIFQELSDNSVLSVTKNATSDIEIFKLYQNGSIDNITFTSYTYPDPGSYISTINKLENNQILLTTNAGGLPQSKLILLNSNGTLDNSNNFGLGFDLYYAYSVKIQSDNKIILGGNFKSYNGTTKHSIIRLKKATLSTQHLVDDQLFIFPTPVKETISFSKSGNLKFEIFDLSGKIVLEGNSENQINVSSLSKGVYVLKLKTNEKTINQKFIKE